MDNLSGLERFKRDFPPPTPLTMDELASKLAGHVAHLTPLQVGIQVSCLAFQKRSAD